MPIPLGEQQVIEVVHTGECGEGGSNSKTIQNVYHFQRQAFGDPVVKSAIFTAWKAAIGDKVILCLNERFTSQNVKIRIMNDAEDRFSTHTFTDPGAIAGDSLPSHEAAVILLKSDTRGRWAQGRKHFAPLSEADIGDDILSGAALTAFGVVVTNLLAGFTDSNGNVWKSAILSKTYSQIQTNPTVTFVYPVTEVILNKTIGTMRSRKARTVQ